MNLSEHLAKWKSNARHVRDEAGAIYEKKRCSVGEESTPYEKITRAADELFDAVRELETKIEWAEVLMNMEEYDEGIYAYQSEATRADNPHARETDQREAWEAGWNASEISEVRGLDSENY